MNSSVAFDSGIPWVGDVPHSWRVAPLLSVCTERKEKNVGNAETNVLSLSYGRIVRRDVSTNFGLLPESFETYHRVHAGDVVLRLTDLQNDQTSLRVGLALETGIITSAYVTLRCSDAFIPAYFFYLLYAYDVQKVFYGLGGGVRQSIKFADLRRVQVPLPPIETQRRIARYLDAKLASLDAIVARKERLVALLLEQRKSVVSEAITRSTRPSEPRKDTGLPWLESIPAHWKLLRLKQISHRISGRLVYQPAQYFSDEGVPFIMGNNVTERGIVLDQTKFIPPEVNARFAHHALREGDVVMVRVGAPGVTAVVGPEAAGLNCGSLMIVRRNPAFHSPWLAAVMNSPVVRAQIDLVQYGAAQEQINITDAVNFWIPTPPLEEQQRIAEFVTRGTQQLDRTTDKVREQIAKLREYRQALIASAATGKLDFSEEAA